MLSFDKGIPVAKIQGGKNDGKIIHIYDNSDDVIKWPHIKLTNSDVFEILGEDYFKSRDKKISYEEMEEIKKSLIKDIEPINKNLIDIYEKTREDVNKKLMNEFIIIDDGNLILLPRKEKNQRDSIFVAGPSGSGKSYIVGLYAREFQKMYPKRKIFLFSKVEQDEELDKINGLHRIKIDDELALDPITLDELELSLVIFDDIDTIRDEETRFAVSELRKDILETGRHAGSEKKNTSKGIFIISTNHMLSNYKETRELINEANKIIFFPKSGGRGQIEYYLKKYMGMNNKEIKKVFSLDGRYVIVSTSYPQFIMSSKSIYLVSSK